MDLKSVKVLAILAAIIGSAQSGAALPTSEDVESAKVVADLIQAGKLKVDAETGKVLINTNVLDVLRGAGFVRGLKAEEVQVGFGECRSSGGNGTK